MSMGERVALLRRQAGLSQEQLGDKLGVSRQAVSKWESGQANPDLQLIVCGNDNMGIGALSAVQEAGLEEQISIIGFDAVSEALNLVESGEFLGTVAQYPAVMGQMGVEAMLKVLKGEEVPLYTDTGCALVTKENVAEFKEYVAQFVD